MKKLILALALCASPAMADGSHPPLPRDDGFAMARAVYDCPPGPGYLQFTIIDAYQQKFTKTLFVGSREICQQMANNLYRSRSRFGELTLVGICAGQDEVYYLKRWSVDPWGRHVFQGQTYYGPLADCQAEADRTNDLR